MFPIPAQIDPVDTATDHIDSLSVSGPIEAAKTAAEKWHNPLGPPVGSNFGARLLGDEEDVFTHNAW